MKNNILEIEIENSDFNLEINVTEEETIREIKQTIMKIYDYKGIGAFQLYINSFHLNEFYDNFKMKFFMDRFSIKTFKVLKKSHKQLYEEKNIDFNIKTLYSLKDQLSSQVDYEDCLMYSLEEMKNIEANLIHYSNELDKKLKVNVDDKTKIKQVNHLDYLNQIKFYQTTKNTKKQVLKAKIQHLHTFKKTEQYASVLQNILTDSEAELNVLKETSKKLSDKMKYLKHEENLLLEQMDKKKNRTDTLLKTKINTSENFNYRYSIILKLVSETTVLVYNAFDSNQDDLNNECNIRSRKFKDNPYFADIYTNQIKRNELFLNFEEKLFIAIQKYVFLYDYKSNRIYEMSKMLDDHKGGSLIYAPGNNSIYCITGLETISCEVLNLELLDQFLESKDLNNFSAWKTIKSVNSPRSYYSSCVINNCIIYLLFGFDLYKGEFLSTIETYDTSNPNSQWTDKKIKYDKPIKLLFSGVISTSTGDIFILGGKDEHNIDSSSIYVYKTNKSIIEDTKMKLPFPSGLEILFLDNKNLFYQESCFLPLHSSGVSSNDLLFCCFDTKNFVHKVNIKTFDYTYIQEKVDLIIELDDEESNSLGPLSELKTQVLKK